MRIDARLEKMEARLTKVEAKSKAAPKPRAPKEEEPDDDLYMSDVFPPIMDVLEEWNIDRRSLLKVE